MLAQLAAHWEGEKLQFVEAVSFQAQVIRDSEDAGLTELASQLRTVKPKEEDTLDQIKNELKEARDDIQPRPANC